MNLLFAFLEAAAEAIGWFFVVMPRKLSLVLGCLLVVVVYVYWPMIIYEPNNFALMPQAAQICVGESEQLELLVQDRKGEWQPADIAGKSWSTDNPMATTVTESGLVEGRGPGTAVITLTVGPDISASSTIEVVDAGSCSRE
jgi:hypothetical protein